jgi:hypothetical protein
MPQITVTAKFLAIVLAALATAWPVPPPNTELTCP